MPYDELLGWNIYFGKRPVGWREDQRTMLIMQSFGVKQKPEQIFNSLAVLKEAEIKRKEEGRVAMEDFKRSTVFRFLANTELPPVFNQ